MLGTQPTMSHSPHTRLLPLEISGLMYLSVQYMQHRRFGFNLQKQKDEFIYDLKKSSFDLHFR